MPNFVFDFDSLWLADQRQVLALLTAQFFRNHQTEYFFAANPKLLLVKFCCFNSEFQQCRVIRKRKSGSNRRLSPKSRSTAGLMTAYAVVHRPDSGRSWRQASSWGREGSRRCKCFPAFLSVFEAFWNRFGFCLGSGWKTNSTHCTRSPSSTWCRTPNTSAHCLESTSSWPICSKQTWRRTCSGST